MAKDKEAQCKQCRSAGMKLYLKGERCQIEDKCGFKRRSYPPGHLGRFSRRERNMSEYGKQLKEKQRARRMYGVSEVQFRRYFEMAAAQRGITGEALFQALERRLDNVVYRLGFASSRGFARQLVRHRHIKVNGKLVDIPSYLVRANDVVEVKEQSKKIQGIRDSADAAAQRARIPSWLQTSPIELKGTVLELPAGDKLEIPFEEHLIVEFYSR
ncbi:MAG TPA: 30S ribosomal protein S4 [bacterium]|nr:MAG: 30S ribosomal protein S4 [bacterium ADurb.Bin236]HOC92645.1 30S ribosomal protein S4 [bacterium]HPI75417.1 30S ribosomal protein S4 [bacterium]HPN93447.1 30S ribosomal protein S4 [bacterium]